MSENAEKHGRSYDEARHVHQVLGDLCLRLIDDGWLEFQKPDGERTIIERAVRFLCSQEEPVSRSRIGKGIGTSKTARGIPNLGALLTNQRKLHERLTAKWHEKVDVDFPIVIATHGGGRGARRYLDLDVPESSIGAVDKAVLQVQARLRDLRCEEWDFTYLRRIDRLLKYKDTYRKGDTDRDKWFQKQGPTWSDFEKGRVLRDRERLEKWKERILGTPFLLIEGTSATGKTCLVRTLGYEWLEEEGLPVYYFSFGEGFDRITLQREIQQLQGIAIVEDIHTDPDGANFIYSRMDCSPGRHVVFTARPQWRQYLNRRHSELAAVETEKLEPFDYAKPLIDFFSRKQGLVPSEEDAQKLKEVSEESYWLLAYALKGYAQDPDGAPEDWIGDEVKRDLDDLRRENLAFPKILVSLAPLYMNEVPTAAGFLTDKNGLGFSPGHVQKLHRLGEILRLEQDDHIFYGLPHSALACAYWRHGGAYRNGDALSGIEAFIYDYAVAETPNGLKAVVQADERFRGRLLARIAEEGTLHELVQRSSSLKAVRHLIEVLSPEQSSRELMRAIAGKVQSRLNELLNVSALLWDLAVKDPEEAGLFWEGLDYAGLAEEVNETENLSATGDVLWAVAAKGPEEAGLFWEGLDYAGLAEKVNEAERFFVVGHVVWAVAVKDPEEAGLFWEGLDYAGLAEEVNEAEDFFDVRAVFRALAAKGPEEAGAFWEGLDYAGLAEKVNEAEEFLAVRDVVWAVAVKDPEGAGPFWEGLNYRGLERGVGVEVLADTRRLLLRKARDICDWIEDEELRREVEEYGATDGEDDEG